MFYMVGHFMETFGINTISWLRFDRPLSAEFCRFTLLTILKYLTGANVVYTEGLKKYSSRLNQI